MIVDDINIKYTWGEIQNMNLKSFDFFRKINSEQELTSSTGGCFTIFSLIIAVILIFLSIQDFTRVEYETSLVIKNDKSEVLPMQIDILFSKVPCQLITLEFHDQLQYQKGDLQNLLTRKIVSQDGTEVDYTIPVNQQEHMKRISEAVKADKKCRLFGKLDLPKTPGTLTFKTQGPNKILERLPDKSIRNEVKISYTLKKLQFGQSHAPFEFPIAHYSPGIKSYIQQLQNNFYTRQVVQDFSSEENRINFYNHLKIIPIYVDDGTYQSNTEKQKYRYSLRAGRAPTREYSPVLEILTQIEPINIMYTRNTMTWYDLSVDILAIVGGSVATIGVINSISHFVLGIK